MHLNKIFNLLALLLLVNFTQAQKKIYIPTFITNSGMDPKDPKSQWSFSRSIETENVVIFWEAGFGSDPNKAANPYKIDLEKLKILAEKTYTFYLDSLRFAIKGNTVLDDYKLMIFLLYTTDWAAYGSGQDDKVGSLFVNPAAANIEHVVAHEIGHCFQYITGCDSNGGFRYGLGDNGKGGNGFWEQCAQWMAYKFLPELQFNRGDLLSYVRQNHLHVLHETPRYENYFLMDYWTFKHDQNFVGKLWRDARFPEDPIEAYKRINNLNQEEFNNEIYEHAARLTTWDLPKLIHYGKDQINIRAQVKMNLLSNNYWQIDSTICLENYGYNSIKLNAPNVETNVSVRFKGIAGAKGFRAKNVNMAGWKFGFVALLKDGQRVYSKLASAKYITSNPDVTLNFLCPNNCEKLWLVVTGSPQSHWKHEWDDNNANDEQWPYQVQFTKTDLLMPSFGPLKNNILYHTIQMPPRSTYDPVTVNLDRTLIAESFAATDADIFGTLGNSIKYYAINPDGSRHDKSTANAPGHWYDNLGKVTTWGNNSFLYSELNFQDLTANIGQYPDQCKNGDTFTIKQALVFHRTPNDSAQVTLVYHVNIKDNTVETIDQKNKHKLILFPNPTKGIITWNESNQWTLYNQLGVKRIAGNGSNANLTNFETGIYFLQIGKNIFTILKE